MKDKILKIIGSTYKERCESQLEHWKNGISLHNKIDNECCPDFSCCHPELLSDEVTRKKFVDSTDEEREGMLFGFLCEGLGTMLGDKKDDVFICDGEHEVKKAEEDIKLYEESKKFGIN